jgi:hypothetical protein
MKRAAPLAVGVAAVSLAGLATAGVLADSVTIRAQSTVLRASDINVLVVGGISSGAEGEPVSVRGKECGVPGAFFRALGAATTTAGGGWDATIFIRTTTTLRAEWKGAESASVTVRRRASVSLTKEPHGFRVSTGGAVGRWDGKRVRIERLTPAGWKLLQTVVVRSEDYPQLAERDGLRFKVPKGTTLRAVLSLSQAEPCYLAGYSKLIRT